MKERRPKEWVLKVFGSIASVGVGAGIGGTATYLALGIQNSLSGNGGWCVSSVTEHDLVEAAQALSLKKTPPGPRLKS